MNQLAAWNPHFPPESKTRGRELFNAQKANLTVPGAGELFRVLVESRSGKSQVVCLKEEGGRGTVVCDTTAFKAGVLCECVWAAFLKLAALAESDEGTAALASHFLALKPKPPKAKRRAGAAQSISHAIAQSNTQPAWATRLNLIKPMAGESAAESIALPRRVHYAVRAKLSARHQALVVEVRQRTAGAAGWSKPKPLRLSGPVVRSLYDADDRRLCSLLMGGSPISEQDSGERPTLDLGGRGPSIFRCPEGATRHLLREMINTGRCVLDLEEESEYGGLLPRPLSWDDSVNPESDELLVSPDGEAWTLCLVGTERLPEPVDAPKTAQDELAELMQEELGQDGLPVDGAKVSQPIPDAALPAKTGRVPVELRLQIERRGLRLDVALPSLLIGGAEGLVILDNRVAPFDDGEAFRWVSPFRNAGVREPLVVAPEDAERFLETLYMLPDLPALDLPESLSKNEQTLEPVAVLELHTPQGAQAHGLGAARGAVVGKLGFAYGSVTLPAAQEGRYATLPPDEEGGQARLVRRQIGRERAFVAELGALGFRPMGGEDESGKAAIELWQIAPGRMPQAVAQLLDKHWRIFADQQVVRSGGPPSLSITTGQDWFELRGGAQFTRADGTVETIPLPRLLASAKNGKPMIRLDDGSMGLLPMEWLEANGLLTEMGTENDDHLRFHRSQAAMLAAALDAETLGRADEGFARIREAVDGFSGIHPEEPTADFRGQLRPYQKDGVGWMSFLRKTHLGGILADDMGLGKTVQVLAMLTSRGAEQRAAKAANPDLKHKASLIVAPRSVVFNWVDEAAKFAPDLKVLCYTGAERADWRDDGFAGYDVVVTTYGLMRRDIGSLENIRFDCVVLDEAQAIKNPQSQSAKAARALSADHRLALTGTPVENHLGDLWSLFEFLNPGMLGSQTRFGRLVRSATATTAPSGENGEGGQASGGEFAGEEAALMAAAKAQSAVEVESDADASDEDADLPGARKRQMAKAPPAALSRVARAIRPFILRRNKEQVLSDLPAKTEQTLRCVMSPEQKRAYDELKAWYRTQLSTRLEADGSGGNHAFMVLEALLRLRQAACHPALITGSDPNAPSAKLDELESRLEEIMEEGSKALVFSQFTSFLAIIQKRLEAKGIRTLMLDGSTRNRKEMVAQFQNDKNIPVFLISLKAGGVGLNLTAAEYVFLTDPWWNPAVEAQAIDRAHRIGQTRPVFAYRLVCEDTVEQRILELQDEKRRLANAVVGDGQDIANAGTSLLQSLNKDELLSLFR